jgi:tetratricopeptide (TPR) repeat protein
MTGEAEFSSCNAIEAALFADALLGGGLPEAAELHLIRAGHNYQCDDIALAHLRQADELAPGHVAVLIGFYRFYFYKGRLTEALEIARRCLAKASAENDLPPHWRDVRASHAEFGDYEKIQPRFFLFTLKGYAYLQMRLGNLLEGRLAVQKLLELDPSDKIGARVLLDAVDRAGVDDD